MYRKAREATGALRKFWVRQPLVNSSMSFLWGQKGFEIMILQYMSALLLALFAKLIWIDTDSPWTGRKDFTLCIDQCDFMIYGSSNKEYMA